MKSFLLSLVLLATFIHASCAPAADPACGMSGDVPDLVSGQATYTLDGHNKTENGGYRLDFPADIVVGTMTINIQRTADARNVKDLVAAGTFPICVPLDSADDGAGYVLFGSGADSYSTSATQTGQLSILAKDADDLLGRFAFSASQNSGSGQLEIMDGAFRLPPR